MYKTIFFLQRFFFFCLFALGGVKKSNVLSWFLLQQFWDRLKVLELWCQPCTSCLRVFLLEYHWEWSMVEPVLPLHICSTPDEDVSALVLSVPAISFGEMATEVTNCSFVCLHMKVCYDLIPFINSPEGQVSWKSALERGLGMLWLSLLNKHTRAGAWWEFFWREWAKMKASNNFGWNWQERPSVLHWVNSDIVQAFPTHPNSK